MGGAGGRARHGRCRRDRLGAAGRRRQVPPALHLDAGAQPALAKRADAQGSRLRPDARLAVRPRWPEGYRSGDRQEAARRFQGSARRSQGRRAARQVRLSQALHEHGRLREVRAAAVRRAASGRRATGPGQEVLIVLRRAELWGGLFWLAVGAFVTWQGWLLELGTLREPGSGFVFFWLGIGISALSVSIVLAGVRGEGPVLGELWRGARWRNVVMVISALIAFGFLFQQLGFVVCSLALLLFLMTVVDPVSPKLSIPISLVASVGVWYVLEKVLLVQLPKGSWLEGLPYLSWLAG
ncbi:MAG: hypothetical protein EPO67_19440 [Reyranella sp.]|nr:MAG: hypothetical protein EPO67_19440 [Reyranella sp.]